MGASALNPAPQLSILQRAPVLKLQALDRATVGSKATFKQKPNHQNQSAPRHVLTVFWVLEVLGPHFPQRFNHLNTIFGPDVRLCQNDVRPKRTDVRPRFPDVRF